MRCRSSSPAPTTRSERWLPDLAAGRRLIAFALTESAAGSDPAATKTRATARDGAEYVLDGDEALHQPCQRRRPAHRLRRDEPRRRATQPAASARSSSRPTSPGFKVARLEHKMGIRGSPTAELAFDGVRVPAANRLGDEGEGFAIAMRTFERSRPGIAAQAVGIAQGALDEAIALRAGARPVRQADRRAADDPGAARRHGAPRPRRRGRCCTAPARRSSTDPPEDAARWAAMCKLIAGDTAMRVTTDAVQVLGGYGYIEDFPVERMMRDAKITQLYEGTQQIQRLVIARALLRAAQDLSAAVTESNAGGSMRIVVLTKPVPDPDRVGAPRARRPRRSERQQRHQRQRRIRARSRAEAHRDARRRGDGRSRCRPRAAATSCARASRWARRAACS